MSDDNADTGGIQDKGEMCGTDDKQLSVKM